MESEGFKEPPSKRRRLEEETKEPAVVIKRHLKRGKQESGAETASEWDDKESMTALGSGKGATVTRTLRTSAKWDTPRRTAAMMNETPRRNRWDKTPVGQVPATPIGGRITATPSRFTNAAGQTPVGRKWDQTPGGG